ncbi:MAG: hypothetical protein NT070_10475 [Cyanobacteria bacterium]|nr:hypothetical protein [Cyanobacteriota bacterium]
MSRSSAQPPLSFIAPNLDLKIVWLTKCLLPFWMRSKTSIAEVRAVDLEKLVRVYQDFEGQKVRVLLAFRHPSVDDPVAIGYVLNRLLPKTAQKMGITFRKVTHAHYYVRSGYSAVGGNADGQTLLKTGGYAYYARQGRSDGPQKCAEVIA